MEIYGNMWKIHGTVGNIYIGVYVYIYTLTC